MEKLKPSGSFVSVSLQASQINPLPHPFTFESQDNSCSQIDFTENDFDTNHTECRLQVERQYKLKMESLTKQYQVKIARERETFQLKEKNYDEEIENLKRQLRDFLNRKNQKKDESQYYCSLCSNGEVINYMKNMLDSVEQSHKYCLSQKQQLNNQIELLSQKISVVQEECLLTEEKYKKTKQQIRQYKQQKDGYQREKREKQRQYRQKERLCQVKQMELDQELNKAKALEKQLQKQVKTINIEKYKQTIDHEGKMREKQDKENTRNMYQIIDPRQRLYEKQTDSIGHQLSKNSSYLKPININNSHAHPNWKTKMNESYADYAGMKRKNKRPEYTYDGIVDFQTFRPQGKYAYLE